MGSQIMVVGSIRPRSPEDTKKRAAPAHPPYASAYKIRLRPPATPDVPCDNQGNQARRSRANIIAQVDGSGTAVTEKAFPSIELSADPALPAKSL